MTKGWIALALCTFAVIACDPGHAVVIVNDTEQDVLLNREGFLRTIEVGSSYDGFGVFDDHDLGVLAFYTSGGKILLRKYYTWDELLTADFRITLSEELRSAEP